MCLVFWHKQIEKNQQISRIGRLFRCLVTDMRIKGRLFDLGPSSNLLECVLRNTNICNSQQWCRKIVIALRDLKTPLPWKQTFITWINLLKWSNRVPRWKHSNPKVLNLSWQLVTVLWQSYQVSSSVSSGGKPHCRRRSFADKRQIAIGSRSLDSTPQR